jgi:hypothetical protein
MILAALHTRNQPQRQARLNTPMKASNFVIVALLEAMIRGGALTRAAAPGTTFDLVAETGAQVPELPGVTFSA